MSAPSSTRSRSASWSLHGIHVIQQGVPDRPDHLHRLILERLGDGHLDLAVRDDVLRHRRVGDQSPGVGEPLREVAAAEPRRDLAEVGAVDDLARPRSA